MRYASLLLIFALSGPAHAQETDPLLQSLEALESPNAPALVADLRRRANNGDPTAQYWYGRYLHDLSPLEARNFTEARSWLDRASAQGHLRATAMLARIHEVGFVVPASREQAAQYYARLVELGQTNAGHDLARLAFAEEPRDGEAIIRHLEVSARGGHAQSIIDLAYLYAAGTLGDANGAEAHRWAMRGVDLNLPRAMNLLARLYANGLGVEADAAEALKWAILAREAGDEDAAQLALEIAAAVPEEVQHEARARALAWLEANPSR